MGQLERKLQRWQKDMPEAAGRALGKASKHVVQVTKRKHLSGPRMPVGVGSQTKPTIDSKGSLRNSLSARVRVAGKRSKTVVRSRHALSRIHHEGAILTSRDKPFRFLLDGRWIVTRRIRMPARPFLAAAVRSSHKRILAFLKDEMIKSYKSR